MKRLALLFLVLLTAIGATAKWTVSSIPNPKNKWADGFVSNPDNILGPVAVHYVDSVLRILREDPGCEVAVVVVGEIDDPDHVEDFATRLFNRWGVGGSSKDNGILVLVSMGDHVATIRTGDGAEGFLPDIICGRIINDAMIPYLKKDDCDNAIAACIANIEKVVRDPKFREDMVEYSKKHASQQQSFASGGNSSGGSDDSDSLVLFILGYTLAVICTPFILLKSLWKKTRPKNGHSLTSVEKYNATTRLFTATWVCGILFFGFPFLVTLLLKVLRSRWRNGSLHCSNCNAKMRKLDEEADNAYLNSGQNMEEDVGSVEYDVWLCPSCGQTEVLTYSKSSSYKVCPKCKTKTYHLLSTRTIERSTTRHSGRGVRTYLCEHCRHKVEEEYVIPMLSGSTASSYSSSSYSSSSSSSYSGGSWGGGHSNGGEATGRW